MIPYKIKVSKPLLAALGVGGLISFAIVVVVVVVIVRAWWGLPISVFGFGDAPDQPIAFPHTVHVQELGLDCTFCHRSVTSSSNAGIPPVSQCMFCHKIVGDGKPEIEKLRDFAASNEPIDWVRVHRVPDHVHFVHEAHIRFFSVMDPETRLPRPEPVEASAVCSTCHGDVGSMVKVKQVRSLKMGDCVDCHRDFSAPTDCTTCHF